MELIKGLVLVVGSGISCALLLAGLKVWFAEKGEYCASKTLTGSMSNALRGQIKTIHGGTRNCRVKAGLAIDRRTNTWVEQGALTEESINTVLH